MHVAATNPMALDASGVDPAVIEREKAILRDKNAGKPDHVIAEDRRERPEDLLQGSHASSSSPSCIDPRRRSPRCSRKPRAKVGAPVALKGFVRFALGEGIEKEESDFAAEVAAAAGARPEPSFETAASRRRFHLGPCMTARRLIDGGAHTMKRVLVKLSGEALMAPDGYWLDPQTLTQLAEDLGDAVNARASRSRWSSAAATSSAAPA